MTPPRTALVVLLLVAPAGRLAAQDLSPDVLVYGATPAGIAAACAAADAGRTVVLAEPTARVGGMITCGLSHADFRTFEGLTGAYLDFTRHVEAHYRREYGPDSPQAKGNFRGTHAEPKVNLAVFEKQLADHPRIAVLRSHALAGVVGDGDAAARSIREVTLAGPRGRVVVRPRVVIDATYEGDLMAAIGVEHRVGREGRAEYGESLAPETADGQLQGYNFRLVMTRDERNRAAVPRPAGYDRADFVGILPLLRSGALVRVFGREGEAVVFKAQYPALPNDKFDINDVSRGKVRLSLPGDNLRWPGGDNAARKAVFDAHVRWNVGLLHFLQTDPDVPEPFRADARAWGLCKDEFADTGHLPPQLYVREARRMVGRHVFTQKDVDPVGDARSPLRPDAIAVGDYGPNCHGTGHEGGKFGGKHTGEFYHPVPPYQIPYGVLVPKTVTNLLVPGAVSASHVGFCALRLEPIWMSLGQASGAAAHLAVERAVPVEKVPVPALQAWLHKAGAATVYLSDVPREHPAFAAAQWWGTAGGFHGLHPAPAKQGQRGKQIVGQYYEAFPGHDVGPDRPLTMELAARWRPFAEKLGVPAARLPAADGRLTIADWLRAAQAARPRD